MGTVDDVANEEFYVNGVCIGCNYALYMVAPGSSGYCANVHCPLRVGAGATSSEHVQRLARQVVLLRRALKLGRTTPCSSCDGLGGSAETKCPECYGAAVERANLVMWVRAWEDGPGFGCPDGFTELLQKVADDMAKLPCRGKAFDGEPSVGR